MEFTLGELFCGPGGIAQGALLSVAQRSKKDGQLCTVVYGPSELSLGRRLAVMDLQVFRRLLS